MILSCDSPIYASGILILLHRHHHTSDSWLILLSRFEQEIRCQLLVLVTQHICLKNHLPVESKGLELQSAY